MTRHDIRLVAHALFVICVLLGTAVFGTALFGTAVLGTAHHLPGHMPLCAKERALGRGPRRRTSFSFDCCLVDHPSIENIFVKLIFV